MAPHLVECQQLSILVDQSTISPHSRSIARMHGDDLRRILAFRVEEREDRFGDVSGNVRHKTRDEDGSPLITPLHVCVYVRRAQ